MTKNDEVREIVEEARKLGWAEEQGKFVPVGSFDKLAAQICQLFSEPKPDESRLLEELELDEILAAHIVFGLPTGLDEDLVKAQDAKTAGIVAVSKDAECQQRVEKMFEGIQDAFDSMFTPYLDWRGRDRLASLWAKIQALKDKEVT